MNTNGNCQEERPEHTGEQRARAEGGVSGSAHSAGGGCRRNARQRAGGERGQAPVPRAADGEMPRPGGAAGSLSISGSHELDEIAVIFGPRPCSPGGGRGQVTGRALPRRAWSQAEGWRSPWLRRASLAPARRWGGSDSSLCPGTGGPESRGAASSEAAVGTAHGLEPTGGCASCGRGCDGDDTMARASHAPYHLLREVPEPPSAPGRGHPRRINSAELPPTSMER